jgi:hypothetical protein
MILEKLTAGPGGLSPRQLLVLRVKFLMRRVMFSDVHGELSTPLSKVFIVSANNCTSSSKLKRVNVRRSVRIIGVKTAGDGSDMIAKSENY